MKSNLPPNSSISIWQSILCVAINYALMMFSLFASAYLFRDQSEEMRILYGLLAVLVMNLLFFRVISRLTGHRLYLGYGLTWKAVGLAIVGAAYLFVVINIALSPFLSWVADVTNSTYEAAMLPYRQMPWIGFLSLCVISPLCEELLLRWLVLGGLKPLSGTTVALLLSSLLFAVMHIDVSQGITAFIAGLILGHLYIHTGSITATILMHAVYNAIAFGTMLLSIPAA